MNYKELSRACENRRYVDIEGIEKHDVTVHGKPLKTMKDNWIIVLAVVAAFIGLLLPIFEVKLFFVCLGLFALFVLLFIYGNTYTVTCGKDSVKVKQGFQNFEVKHKEIKNVFVSRTLRRALFANTYVLVIRCEDAHAFLREIELPLLCSDVKETEEFVNNFKISEKIDERYVLYERRKSLRRLIENIATCVIIGMAIWLLFATGVIKLF